MSETAKWSNWSGCVAFQPRELFEPSSEDELLARISRASERGEHLRVAGSGHSFAPLCVSNETLVSLNRLRGIVSIDQERGEATIRGGTPLHELGEPLLAAGLALENQGDIDRQTLAGAVATGTHGTGRRYGSISTQVVGLKIATAAGRTVDLQIDRDPELMAAAGVSLGALGALVAITLRLRPAYRLHERTWRASPEAALGELDRHTVENDHFEFFWYPRGDRCEMKALNPTDEMPRAASEKSGDRIDWSYRIYPTAREVKFNEIEYALAEEAGPECFLELRRVILDRRPGFAWPLEYRTVAADTMDLSPAHGRATVTISAHEAAEAPYREFFGEMEAIMRAHGGRPHWGKIHTLRAAELRPLYAGWERFHAARRKLDPNGTFLNTHLNELFNQAPPVSSEVSLDA